MNTSNNPSFDEAQAYIFASFSSNDRAVVAPILAAMEQDGYRVWYDTGAPDENAWLKWLSYGLEFGTEAPLILNLNLLHLTFGITVRITVSMVIFIVLSLLVGRSIVRD